MSCGGVGGRCSSDLALLWLWCRPAAIAQNNPPTKTPKPPGAAQKKKKKKKKKPKKTKPKKPSIHRRKYLQVSSSIEERGYTTLVEHRNEKRDIAKVRRPFSHFVKTCF